MYLPPSFALSFSNQPAPSASGATVSIIGFTSITPRAIRSRHSGYSPALEQEPSSESSFVTTACSGKSWVLGARLPTSTQVPPRFKMEIARFSVGVNPTTSKAVSAPRPSVIFVTAARASSRPELIVCVAPSLAASARRLSARSTATICWAPAQRRAWMTSRPIMPLPITTAVEPGAILVRCTAWIAMETGSTIAA